MLSTEVAGMATWRGTRLAGNNTPRVLQRTRLLAHTSCIYRSRDDDNDDNRRRGTHIKLTRRNMCVKLTGASEHGNGNGGDRENKTQKQKTSRLAGKKTKISLCTFWRRFFYWTDRFHK